MDKYPIVFVVILALVDIITSDSKASINFDSFTFDKIVSKFKYTLVKIDEVYPMGDKHQEFLKIAEAAEKISELVVGEIGVKDYDDFTNKDLAERFGVGKKDFPVIFLVSQGQKTGIKLEIKDYTAEDIRIFIKKHTQFWIGLPNCIKEFDDLASNLLISDEKGQKEVLNAAEKLKESLHNERDKKSANTYLKVMKRVVEKGKDFLKTETTRVKRLRLDSRTSDDQKKELQRQLNILSSFTTHDEL